MRTRRAFPWWLIILASIAVHRPLTGAGAGAEGPEPEQGWTNPPATAGPCACWCWLDGGFTKEAIPGDLQQRRTAADSGPPAAVSNDFLFVQWTGSGRAGGLGSASGGPGGFRGAGPRGLSGARSGLGPRSNPVFNPPGSLTPHQVLNPPGSLSTGQVLHPEPSLLRPRSSFVAPADRGVPTTSYRPRSTVSWSQLRGTVRQNAIELGTRLDQQARGAGWKQYLRLDDLANLPESPQGPPDAGTVARLRPTLVRWKETASNQQYRAVSRMPQFQAVRVSLTEYLRLAAERDRRGLVEHWRQLCGSLDHFTTSAAWKKYLELPPAILDGPGEPVPVAINPAAIQKVLDRYERVARDPKFRQVSGLPAFEATRKELAAVSGFSPLH